jgi:pyruvate kinase
MMTTTNSRDSSPHATAPAPDDGGTNHLIEQLASVLDRMRSFEQRLGDSIEEAHPQFRQSARNLIQYLALRDCDLRDLQQRLASLGLSSLGRSEAHVGATLHAVLDVLCRLSGSEYSPPPGDEGIGFEESASLLTAHTDALLGPPVDRRKVRITVTLPAEAADDFAFVLELLNAGMDCARINCAHDSADTWARMVANVQRARLETGRPCRIQMDLAGVKPRTGPMEPGPRVVHVRPQRDERGRALLPARLWLAPTGEAPPDDERYDAVIPVDKEWLRRLRPGDRVRFRDARHKKRDLLIVTCHPEGCEAIAYRGAYIESGTTLRATDRANGRERARTKVGTLPSTETHLLLKKGETLILQRAPTPGRPAPRGERGSMLEPARISCTLPEVFGAVKPGEVVKLNDGKIEGTVKFVTEDELHIEITRAREAGSKLRSGQSLNFPQTKLPMSGLAGKDLVDLDFVARHADIVGQSFVNSPEDVRALQLELAKRNASHLGIMLKIETQHGFLELPRILLAAMRSFPVGVMIARGDLAIECGWERLAEVQEEILWLCEAAHMPVVWATQVLEQLAQKGLPSRAEITDAAMAERAECVMLNKGPYILHAIKTLDSVLRRMEGHQLKKTPLLRNLNLSNVLEE